MIRRVFSSLPWVLLAQVRGQCPSWSEGLVQLAARLPSRGRSGTKPQWCSVNNDNEAAA